MNMLKYQDTVVVFINRGKKPAAYVFSEVGPSQEWQNNPAQYIAITWQFNSGNTF